jgi:hypothetical protein
MTTTLAKRVEKLEHELEDLKKRVEAPASPAQPNDKKRGWMKTLGMSKNDPTFDEAIELGRRWRRRQPKC